MSFGLPPPRHADRTISCEKLYSKEQGVECFLSAVLVFVSTLCPDSKFLIPDTVRTPVSSDPVCCVCLDFQHFLLAPALQPPRLSSFFSVVPARLPASGPLHTQLPFLDLSSCLLVLQFPAEM